MNILCFLCVVSVGVTFGYPSGYGIHSNPRRAYMIGGYYNNPIFSRSREFIPQGSMSAVLTDNIATNSFVGSNLVPEGQLPLEESETDERFTEKYNAQPLGDPKPEVIDIDQNEPSQVPELILDEKVEGVVIAEDPSTEAAVAKPPKRKSKSKTERKPVKKDEDEEEDEEETGSWPFAGARGIPSYNAFFPITISGGSPLQGRRTKSAEEDGYIPSGSATAIANSFSTGRGGIATSHATSFGDPYLASMLLRNGFFNTKSKKADQEA
nr:uncharacterized protein LOC111504345 [Leptinotarsa decemlineata]